MKIIRYVTLESDDDDDEGVLERCPTSHKDIIEASKSDTDTQHETPVTVPTDRICASASPRTLRKSPQDVPEYADDILMFYFEQEKKSCFRPDYLKSGINSHITVCMRKAEVNWIADMRKRHELHFSVFSIAVGLLDRVLACKHLDTEYNLKLTTVLCLFIARKYEDVYALSLSEAIGLVSERTSRTIRRREFASAEFDVMVALDFRVYTPTYYAFLVRFSTLIEPDDPIRLNLAHYIGACSLYSFHITTRYNPSMIAAASVNMALRTTTKNSLRWDDHEHLVRTSTYRESELVMCILDLERLVGVPGACLSLGTEFSTKPYSCASQISIIRLRDIELDRVSS
jgi:cyclin B